MATIRLLDKVSTNTVGEAFAGDGGLKSLVITATSLGGGTITIEFSNSSRTLWSPATYEGDPFEATIPATYTLTKMAAGVYIRATLAGAAGASNVSVELA